MTIAVTAATGHLGSLVVDSLLERVAASEVVAVVRDREKAQPIADRGVEVRVADYGDPEALASALSGVDKLLLISGTDFDQRRQHHVNVIDAAVRNGVSLVAYTSAPGADTSTLPVAPDHFATEQYLAKSGLDHVLLRNGWYHENYAPALEAARQTGVVLTSAGDGRVSSAARADFAEAAAVVLTTDEPVKPVYELGGDVSWSQDELAATIADLLGSPISVAQVGPEEQAKVLTEAGVPPVWVQFGVDTDASISNGELEVPGHELSTLIGRPTTPLADSLRAAL
ncbi:SDR family oxidoreductase [Aeromicrobium chenweiae]|uniref:NAD(P)-dependent oxidoreductase n=1 Tax=Aeromicrobium chenweiae TaxID=2079793 RepID=A0A2S0WJH3_9ACTN|nr:SDR family oxidoreductase [Aeromicrobium chenweiae]AWB91495.1 NAD(P)-dependent oxidoreductase [Aeromicrobium chenweiae]TGN29978.1 SDR family oxidoreductase [Aeromicrobium chenweiae]